MTVLPESAGLAPSEDAPTGERPWSCGLLAVDKPTGVTSHDVVDKVRRRLRVKSAGHLGTLDPAASGLLLIALGAATRAVPVWQGGEKTYEGTARFGVVTSTQDLQGEVLEEHPVTFDEEAVRARSRAWEGEIEQVPPMVSALRVGGERLYRLARRGVTVERAPRRVRVVSWEWLSFALPEATFRVRCSGGTYVRTLVHDLGAALGSGGALKSLRRVRSEPFSLERSIPMRRLDEAPPEVAWAAAGYSLEEALAHLPSVALDAEAASDLGFGRQPTLEDARVGAAPRAAGPRSVVFRDAGARVLALGELQPGADGGTWKACPHVLFPWAVRSGRPDEARPR